MKIASSVTPFSLSQSLEIDPVGPLVLDLSTASFVEPYGLVGVAVLAEQAVSAGREVTFVPPTNPNVRNYLSRMRLGEVLTDLGITHGLPVVNANPLQSELLELQKFSGQGGGEAVATLVFDKLEAVGADNEVRQTLFEAVCEVAGNVDYHANVPHGYVAAQTTHQGGKVSFAIADSGQGLMSSLAAFHDISDDAEAIDLAVKEEVSGTGERGRGQGLPTVVSTSVGLNGNVHIASGNARNLHSRNGVNKFVTSGSFPGTAIQVELNCSTGL